MRLIASDAALDLLVAVDQAGETRLTAIAQAADVPLSTAQKAMEVLMADGLTMRTATGRYQPNDTATNRAALELALLTRSPERLARIIGMSNPGVELIGRTDSHLIVVASRHAGIEQRLRARYALVSLAQRLGLEFVERQHDDLRTHRMDFAQEHAALAEGSVLYGDVELTYPPVPSRPGAVGHPLGHLHPTLPLPSARRLRDLSRRHGVRRMEIFGSAVRDDFRPDSDVDVAIDLQPGVQHRVLSELEEQLERLFDRDVDVVLRDLLRDKVRREVDEHGVSLVG